MNKNTIEALKKMIEVNTPIIYIQDFDFVRVDDMIANALCGKTILEWNPVTGSTDFFSKRSRGAGAKCKLRDFLYDRYAESSQKEIYLVLKEVHSYLDLVEIKSLLLLMAQRKLYDSDYEVTIIIVSSILNIPREIERFVYFLEKEYPSDEEVDRLIDEHVEVNCYDRNKFTQKDREKLKPFLKGMHLFDIDRVLDMAMSSNGSLSAEDTGMILRLKKQMVKKSGLLELIDSFESMDDIGGLDALRNYLKRKSVVISRLTEAQRFGVAIPKGILIIGMPGCGKSLCAKATSVLFQAPLLKLDMGSMMGKYVGESEANLRQAIRIAEAAAPCVLWIDEIEKAFTGVGAVHSDILTRMFGYFLSWMQDKKSAVYVVATANNADNLPPELKRKGRFDEIFCVNLPNANERKDIFKVHLKKRKKQILDLSDLVIKTEGFNGADIEAVVVEAIESVFLQNRKDVTVKDLLSVASKTVSISQSCKEQIEKMKKQFQKNCFKDANTGSMTSW